MTGTAADSRDIPLKLRLRRGQRRQQQTAFLLVLPLFLLMLVVFVIPLGAVLYQSVHDPDVAHYMPRTTAALRDWNGSALPEEPVFAALAKDLQTGYADKSIAKAATRLNYQQSGFRSLVMKTARKADEIPGPPFRDAVIALQSDWGELAYWRELKAASQRHTTRNLLAAIDLDRQWDGSVKAVDPDRAIYRDHLMRTFEISLAVVVLAVIIGYPMAFMIATAPKRLARILLIMVLLTFWVSLLVRTAAWVIVLNRGGIINEVLLWSGLVGEPLELMYNRLGVYIAMVHIVLPFMILPLYSVMVAIPDVHLKAAYSLGARPFAAFRQVYLPQTLPGLGAGCLLVFILCIGFYITPALMGGRTDQMLAYLIAEFTLRSANWGMASALAVVLLASIALLYPLYNRYVGFGKIKLG